MAEKTEQAPHLAACADLVALARIDTLYRDRYLARLRSLLASSLPIEAYRNYQQQRTRLGNLPNQIRNAMNDEAWGRVRDLSREYAGLKAELERHSELLEIGAAVYADDAVPIDPFSPGMNTIPGVTRQRLGDLRDEACRRLVELGDADPEWQPLYHQRRQAHEQMEVSAAASNGIRRASVTQLESDAIKALREGNFDRLASLAEDLETSSSSAPGGDIAGHPAPARQSSAPDYLFHFSPATTTSAQRLGLAWEHVPSRQKELSPLCAFAWHPTFSQVQDDHASMLRLPQIDLPRGTPEALKSRVEVFAAHPLVNSAGIRFLPALTAEDVLVETFDEPGPGESMPASRLLEILGLPQRNQLSRRRLEDLLLKRGDLILRDELDLDPLEFRLVCIPPDLYLRLGLERGWGKQRLWTHFDGYMVMMNGSLRALAGGDVRFGGVYDLLGISRDYDSERILARFAVVQRRRLARRT